MKFAGRLDSVLRPAILLSLLVFLTASPQRSSPPAVNETTSASLLQRLFQSPPDDSKIMMRWWWFGPAVTKPELEREMRRMKEGGIGGFEVQPVYPLALDDATTGIRNLPFLSDEFIDALRFTAEKAHELGLRMDLTLGSGWPYGGPQIPIGQAAGWLRTERIEIAGHVRRVPMPDIGAGERLIAVFLARSQGQSIVAKSLREITDIRDGWVRLPAGPDESHDVLFFIASRTGMMVKRAALGAEGFVLDHYDRTALENYLRNVGDRLMRAFESQPPYAIFCDSLEVYNSNWTGDLLQEFRKRRGYDLKPYLPALIADIGEETAAVRHDWGKTLTELANERFLAPMHDWSQRNRTRFRVQAYGIPPVALSSYALADLPEGEGVQWKTLSATRWASSAGHLYGHPVTSSETWTWLHSPAFRATPLDVKAEADLHFLQGINQLIGHGWPYSPEGVAYPGWRFYAAGVFNDKNPWWLVMPDLSLYLQRINFLLRQGRPVNDVAIYLPNSDAWSHFSAGRVNLFETLRDRLGKDVVARVLEAGYGLDFIDDGVIDQHTRVEKGELALGDRRYRVVVLPGVERIPLNTLRKLEEFARGGGILIATRRLPALAPGRMASQAEQEVVRVICRRLFEGPSASAHYIEDESGALGNRLTRLLRPDVSLSPSIPEIGFVHRSTEFAEIYFLANTSNRTQHAQATFRVESLQPEWWDPMTGRVSAADVLARSEEATTVALDLEPYGSRVLVFSKRTLSREPVRHASAVPPPFDLSTGWKLSFGSNGPPITLDRLRSWTEDEQTRYFSGLATYEKEVVVPETLLQPGLQVRLDFGEGRAIPVLPRPHGMRAWIDAPVREAAVVYVNDRRVGSVWCPPYSVDVTGSLRRGENRFRIVVGNLAINHMAGQQPPDYRLLNSRYGVRFEPQNMDNLQPVPAGLLGPVRLIAGPGKRQEARDKKQEARDKKQEARSKRQEARSKRQEVRGKR